VTERTTLEAERDFLLRSLDDLEVERQGGNVDDDTYRVLHDDYTARAAAVIRSLQDGVARPPPAAPAAPRWMRVATVAGILLFAVLAAVLLARAVGTRDPGQTATGNEQQSSEDALDRLAAAATAQPDNYAARIAYARALLGNDPAQALAEYDAAGRLDPTQAEPPTYVGWISALAARGLEAGPERDEVIGRALESLKDAVELDAGYADAYVFRGLVRYNLMGDAAGAVPDFQLFLVNAPDNHPMRETVLGVLARAESESAATTTTVTSR
jgi:tetratricopeptide (TPR) repeat protein